MKSIALRFLPMPPRLIGRDGLTRQLRPGDCWYGVRDGQGGWWMYADGPSEASRFPLVLAPKHRGARPIMVVLPTGMVWCLHWTSTAGDGWDVTGELPNVTVSPSIYVRHPGSWHGWIRDGVMETV